MVRTFCFQLYLIRFYRFSPCKDRLNDSFSLKSTVLITVKLSVRRNAPRKKDGFETLLISGYYDDGDAMFLHSVGECMCVGQVIH